MNLPGPERTVYKKSVLKSINVSGTSALKKYQTIFVGRPGLWALLRYEWCTFVLAPMPGALGLFLRKALYAGLFRRAGSGVVWGRNISLRHPGKISVGNRVAIDDGCLLDARGAGEEGISIGDDVLIARNTIIQAKASPITIGDRCTIASQCQLSAAGEIRLGRAVMVGGQCYIGGGRYRTGDRSVPMTDQELYSRGPVVIEDDVWIGAGVTILDGVRIGTGSVIGAGALVREDVPPFTVATPYHKLVLLPRAANEAAS
jgi:acetyltransferase-like isoleucine patch superfamily enzyme